MKKGTDLSAPLMERPHGESELAAIGRYFHGRGWSVGTSSNYSVLLSRDPFKLLITASGKDKGRLQAGANDFVLVGPDGKGLSPSEPKPSAETLLHCIAAQRPDVGAVLHTHSVWGTVLSEYYGEDEGFPISGFEMLKGLEGIKTHESEVWVQIFPNTQDMVALSQVVRDRLADPVNPLMYGFLMRRHGLYTWGATLDEARRHVEIFEFLFEVLGRELSLRGVGNAAMKSL